MTLSAVGSTPYALRHEGSKRKHDVMVHGGRAAMLLVKGLAPKYDATVLVQVWESYVNCRYEGNGRFVWTPQGTKLKNSE